MSNQADAAASLGVRGWDIRGWDVRGWSVRGWGVGRTRLGGADNNNEQDAQGRMTTTTRRTLH